MKRLIDSITIEIVQGDIANQNDITAVVNAANAQLRPGGGVAGAIHRKAGPGLYKECLPLAPIKTGQAVITKGYNLPNRFVIHTLGPVYSSANANVSGVSSKKKSLSELLADCYRNSLLIANQNGVDSIAFPAISAGIFGYPINEAAGVALNTVVDTISHLKSLKLIRFVLYSSKDYTVFKNALGSVS